MRCFGAVRARILDWFRALCSRCLLSLQLAGLFSLVAACSSAPKLTYDLNPAADGRAARGGHGQLAISVPDATLPANSDGIVVRTSSQSVAYLEGAQWVDRLPTLIQSRLIESFQNAHVLRAVGRPGILADATLQTTLRRFDLDAARSEAAVEIFAQLIGTSGRILAGHSFAATVPVPSAEPAAVTTALDMALRQVMREIVMWAASKV
jgi:cholesterol transport system auxiliary component